MVSLAEEVPASTCRPARSRNCGRRNPWEKEMSPPSRRSRCSKGRLLRGGQEEAITRGRVHHPGRGRRDREMNRVQDLAAGQFPKRHALLQRSGVKWRVASRWGPGQLEHGFRGDPGPAFPSFSGQAGVDRLAGCDIEQEKRAAETQDTELFAVGGECGTTSHHFGHTVRARRVKTPKSWPERGAIPSPWRRRRNKGASAPSTATVLPSGER